MEITTTVSVPIVISIPDPAVDNPGIPSATQVIRAKCPKKHGQRPNPASDRIRVCRVPGLHQRAYLEEDPLRQLPC